MLTAQSSECQRSDWTLHKPICRPLKPGEVWGIEMLSIGDARQRGIDEEAIAERFLHVLLPSGHVAFSKAELCPVTKMCGIALHIYSRALHFNVYAENGGNQPAVYLRIEPHDGLAPAQ